MTVKVTKPAINVREELADLRKPTGIAGEAMLRAETPQEQFNLIGAGRRNIIINGDFQVSQRGDFTTASSAVNQQYFVDRWFTDVGAVAFTKEQTTGIDTDGLPAISKGVKLTATASGTSYMGIRQKIENPTQYIGRTFTYSGWVKSNSSKARLSTYINGSVNQSVVSDTHSGNGQWEKLSMTFTITGNPSTSWFVDAFILSDSFNATPITSGDYIEVTNLQLELGKVATPFEHRSYGEELALCQRYYQKSYDIDSFAGDNDGNGAIAFIPVSTQDYVNTNFPISMRASPNITVYRKNGGATNQAQRADNAAAYLDVTVADISTRGFSVTPATAVSNSHYRFHYLADAEL
jgi:hypothetical protein